jgi:sulfide:quinone oxidoreductase
VDDQRFSVLIAGGGVAALEAALTLADVAEELVRVEVLAPTSVFSYRPVAVAEPFGLGVVRRFELGRLVERAGATLTVGALAGVDADRRVARTTAGMTVPYDALLIACGAVPKAVVPGSLAFRGPGDTDALGALLAELERGDAARVVFAVPWGAAWPLPAYELALMTARRLERAGRDVHVSVVSPEPEPLRLFGRHACDAVRDMLSEAGVEFVGGVYPMELRDGQLLHSGGAVPADRVVSLPRLRGRAIDGIAQTVDGFVPIDDHCGVIGVEAVFAAGDITSFPVKQGGIAAQQAVVAAEAIAVLAGAAIVPHPFRPVLRGLLLTGDEPAYLRHDMTGEGEPDWASAAPIWWPPTKIVGRRLTPFLASVAGETPPTDVPEAGAIHVDVPLDTADVRALAAGLPVEGDAYCDPADSVGSVMRLEPLLVPPDATLESIGRMMREHDTGSVLVVEAGRLVGILTARDVLRAVAGGVNAAEAPARRWMTASPIAVGPHTPVDVAGEMMAEHGIHHLPVVAGGDILGLVGLRDVNRSRRRSARLPVGLGF